MTEYSLVAGTYDFFLTPFLWGMRKRILKTVCLLNPDAIIDLCCGTGHQLKLLKCNGFSNLTCVDLSEDMLRVAGRGRYSPDCLQVNATDTGLISGSFDVVIISLALHEKPHKVAVAVLCEAYRLLKPGANLIVSDFQTGVNVPFLVKKAITLIEGIAGSEHFINYKSYIKRGGLNGLYDKTSFEIMDRYPVTAGGIVVEVWKKIG